MSAQRTPGDVLLHPVVLGAVIVLALNDHFLKRRVPSVITGKLSDIAGLVFFPLLLLALGEGVRRLAGVRPWSLSVRALVIAVVLTGAAFCAVKVSSPMADAYSYTVGFIEWPTRLIAGLISGSGWPAVRPVWVLADWTDLVALPALIVAFVVGSSVIRMRAAVRGRGIGATA
jgi:hypothetical protein